MDSRECIKGVGSPWSQQENTRGGGIKGECVARRDTYKWLSKFVFSRLPVQLR